ncbi:hypothetical protein BDZ89DRAFT_1075654, partial [Hymenopellis radicata]
MTSSSDASQELQSFDLEPNIRDGMFHCLFRDMCPGLAAFPTQELLVNHYSRVHSQDVVTITVEDPDGVQQTNIYYGSEGAADHNVDEASLEILTTQMKSISLAKTRS